MILFTYSVISNLINKLKNKNDDILYKCENTNSFACLREIIIHKLNN